MNDRDELVALRRLAELEAKAGGGAPAPDVSPKFSMGALVDTVKDIPQYLNKAAGSTVHGVGDLVVGAGQLAANAMPQGMTDRYNNFMQQRDNMYQGQRGRDGVDPARMGGNIAGSLVMGAPTAAATLPGRIAQGAKAGFGMGLTSPVDPNADFLENKALQTGVSTIAGGVAPAVVEPLVKGAGAAANWIGNQAKGAVNTLSGKTSQAAVENTLKVELQRNGVDWNQIGQEIRQNMLNKVQGALKAGESIDPAAIARIADFQKLKMQPLAGQISRNPAEFAREQNLARTEAGAPIAQRLGEHNQQMIGHLESGVPGATATDQYSAGQNVIKSLSARDLPRKKGVTDAYNDFKTSAGATANVPPQPIAQTLGNVIEEHGVSKIPADVSARLKEYGLLGGTQTKVLDLKQAEILRKLVSNNTNFENSAAMKAIKGSIDDAVNGMEGTVGTDAAASLVKARGLASSRLTNIDRTPALENALSRDPVSPEKFIEKFVIRSPIQETANNLRNMQPQARADARAGVLDWIKGQSINGSGDAAKFSQSGLNKALETIGERKLDLIFAGDRGTLDKIRTLARVGGYSQSPPVAAGVNYSNSANTLLNAMDNASRLPIIGAVMGKPSDIVRASQVTRSLGGGVMPTTQSNLVDQAMIQNMARQLGLLGVPSGAFAANQSVNR